MSNVSNKIAMAKTVIAGLVSLLIGRKAVIQWGQHASCGPDGTIRLPTPKVGSPDEISNLTRQAVHEAGHFLETDFTSMGENTQEEKALLSALEDPRIEKLQIERLPGAALVLNRGLEEAIKALNEMFDPDNPEHAAKLVAINVLMRGWLKLAPHEAAVQHGADLIAKGDKVLGERGVAAVEEAVGKLAHARNTGEVAVLARELLAALKAPEQQTEPAQGQSDASSEQHPDDESQQDMPQEASADESQETSADAGSDSQESSAEGTEVAEGADSADANNGGQSGQQDGGREPEVPEQEGQGQQSPDAQGSDPANEAQPAQGEGQPEPEAQAQSEEAQACESQAHSGSTGAAGGQEQSGMDGANGQAGQETGGAEVQGQAQASNRPEGQSQQPAQQSGQAQVDLSSAAGMDLGAMLAMAYEAQFGAAEVSESNQEAPTESDEAVTQALERSLQRAMEAGQDLDAALEQAQAEIEAFAMSGMDESQADQSDGQPAALAAGGGNGHGTVVSLDAAARLSGPVSRLVRVFTKELQDKRRRPVKYAPAGNEVAVNRLWRLRKLGDPNVFRVMHKVTGIDAAAKILLDRSSSMRRCIQSAAETALVCAQALERIQKVKTSIHMFPGHNDDDFSLIALQPFGMSARQAANRLQGVDTGGGTPLAEALQLAVPDLLRQRVQKHLLFVISDGVPNFHDLAVLELQKARLQGVEVFGIGIGEGGKAIQSLIEDSVHINEVSELPGAMEKLFRGQVALKLAA